MAGINFAEGLVYEDNLAVTWEPVEAPLEPLHLTLVSESNEAFLRAISAFGDTIGEPVEESSDVMQELSRLDLKLNLILELVGQVVYRQLDIPGFSSVKLYAGGVQWHTDNVPEPGAKVLLRLYIQRGVPKPLCFYGDVVSNADEQQAGIAKVAFFGLSQSVEDWLEKFIFRQHRRAIAHAKNKPSARE